VISYLFGIRAGVVRSFGAISLAKGLQPPAKSAIMHPTHFIPVASNKETAMAAARSSSPARSALLGLVPPLVAATVCLGQPFVVQDDIVVGWSRSSATDTIRLYDASGQQKTDEWNAFGFVQSVTWDNMGGIGHNPGGNLIGGNFGTTGDGGAIYIYQSGDGWAGVEGFGFGPTAQHTFISLGLIPTRLGGVSVSLDNTKIAFTGNDTAQVYILDYDASAPAITGGRQTISLPMPLVSGVTSGTAWLDADTLLAVSASGDVVAVDNATMTWQVAATVPGANLGGTQFTSIAYSPVISDYIYVSYSNFDAVLAVTTNNLHAIDPAGPMPWPVVKSIDLSVSANTMREIALDSQGNLFFTTHGGIIQKINDVRIPASMMDNSSFQVGSYGSSIPFSGIDVANADNTQTSFCYANCDHSTTPPVLNVEDFVCFINEFANGLALSSAQQIVHYANCDNSTTDPVLNVEDFICFIDQFAQGCP
jgi:hypothetical protein